MQNASSSLPQSLKVATLSSPAKRMPNLTSHHPQKRLARDSARDLTRMPSKSLVRSIVCVLIYVGILRLWEKENPNATNQL